MGPPRRDALEMLLVEIARPPDDFGRMPCEIHHVLAGATAGFHDVAGFAVKEWQQYGADRLMVAMKGRRVEAAIRLDRPPVLAEFDNIFSHASRSPEIAAIQFA